MATIAHSHNHEHHPPSPRERPQFDIFAPLRRWVDGIKVKRAKFAHIICTTIPCTCPFERNVNFLGRLLFHIPPLCKLNPLYEELVSLRFRALTYLADIGEDISRYC
ncbi:MAG: nitrogenase [Oscillatoriales cyanobacterium RM2_1_1]|nr:nitrogenase [Oscillatoriales cyanobacterium SM2_3_0]NJO45437.1 nitrogenase [Oscillatoriales cyanobacterium RM2_1_1]